MNQTLLLIDDEERMLDLLSLYLSPLGYTCVKKSSARTGIEYAIHQNIDLILLDVMMPEMSGWDVCTEIKKEKDIPIIMLTARTDKQDILTGLTMGADDYITKPFDEEILVARIEAVLRRSGRKKQLQFKGLMLNNDSFEVHYQDKELLLTKKEFALLQLFLSHPNKVYTRENLISSVWNNELNIEDRTVDSHVRNLRDKLRQANVPVEKYLKTVWGIGYKWLDV
ncbi:XRE family transcriptional regulator [Alkalihalobacillus alcalophilus ATCC 27647 = CGMCC 1.3604]|uniref:XRE family transcriptional regulator n=1 Tax=Alkalihalobacillus alcalophilus ATCC 27647 = CGMCC 1.3604 TaxID=1218173 RepID=A0A4V3X8Z8_ALKAL|nr:response regulator transcription factor [Alkalihalobacillus alcalophilus]MED1563571.1 response regulator transcription factor [Alkalihalobacillus alcalophilus]THG92292.1 XRE family transcriptional regulator [Alkalihalobacillus alcalophilus ATCC 27647 = CGMCC 1.3604]